MSNMSYCRFENTAENLDDCVQALDRILNNNEQRGEISEFEISGIAKIAVQASWIADQFQTELGRNYSPADVEEFMAPWAYTEEEE